MPRARIVLIVVVLAAVIGAGLRFTVWSDLGGEESEALATLRVVDAPVELSDGSGDFGSVDGSASVDAGSKV
ncbi:MAG: hypothetical protein KY395_00005, partial [Actinobacteria bacterium]|nr:hypothetical protein [Actinomycetota bacterium]